jgi:hypothetical protein
MAVYLPQSLISLGIQPFGYTDPTSYIDTIDRLRERLVFDGKIVGDFLFDETSSGFSDHGSKSFFCSHYNDHGSIA